MHLRSRSHTIGSAQSRLRRSRRTALAFRTTVRDQELWKAAREDRVSPIRPLTLGSARRARARSCQQNVRRDSSALRAGSGPPITSLGAIGMGMLGRGSGSRLVRATQPSRHDAPELATLRSCSSAIAVRSWSTQRARQCPRGRWRLGDTDQGGATTDRRVTPPGEDEVTKMATLALVQLGYPVRLRSAP
jgi:hypothetical protein